ncbi:TPA_asm: hypothetical protein GYP43_02850 [Listeria monocytogenes]|nr:hypothetical protein [Listeria monocytogenes]
MKITIEGTEKEITNILQAIGSSEEHKLSEFEESLGLIKEFPIPRGDINNIVAEPVKHTDSERRK